MNVRTKALLAVASLLAAGGGACSSSAPLGDGHGVLHGDAGADFDAASSDAAPVDDSPEESPEPVWRVGATSFNLRITGGLPEGVPDASCTFSDVSFTYHAATGTLRRNGCLLGVVRDDRMALTPAANAALLAHLTALRGDGTSNNCGSDAPDEVLTVSGAADEVFQSDFYSGCPTTVGTPPTYINSIELSAFGAYLQGLFAACPATPGADAGTAEPTCNEPPVWPSDGAKFSFQVSGGGPEALPDVVDCQGYLDAFTYDPATRTLVRSGCEGGRVLGGTSVLGESAAADLLTHLRALRANGTLDNCGADAPEVQLVVSDAHGAQRLYESDFYTACHYSPAPPPPFAYVAANDMFAFGTYLDGLFPSCDAGDCRDAGDD